jgi:hypothetical protein
MTSPIRPIRTIYLNDDNNVGYVNRIMLGTASRGTVRIEWHNAVRSITIPPNWSYVTFLQGMSAVIPVRFQVADAQNVIVRECLARDFEWLLLIEDDTLPPPDLYIRLNDYMREGKVPVVSGLYYTKSEPSEPLIYRGRGNGAFLDWKMGDQVWCDGVPTGCLMIHHSILKVMWEESEEYTVGGQTMRRVFDSPLKSWIDPDSGMVSTASGTSDLAWCMRIINENVFKKAGWNDYDGVEFPFVVDTNIRCWHITPDGETFPSHFPPIEEQRPPDLGIAVTDGTKPEDRFGS